jgi:drug/metabolite transporter (DMT)-like permease
MSFLVYVVLCLIWGTTWIAIKLGLSGVPPLYGSGIRFLVAVTILSVIVKIRGGKYPRGFRAWLRLAHPGVYMYAASYACVYVSEQWIDSALAAVLFGSYPLFVALFSNLVLPGEKCRGWAWAGLALGIVGVTLISYDSLGGSPHLFLGSMITLLGSSLSAWGLVLHKKTCGHEDIYTSVTVQMGLGALLLLTSAFLFEDFSTLTLSAKGIGSILYLAVFGSVIAFLGYYWLLKKTRAVTVSLISFVTPLVAILVGVFLFHESLSLLTFTGAALILSGIQLVTRK